MKDPLQPGSTPYEVLGVPRGATSEQIDRAFKEKLRTVPIPKLSAARLALQDPVERAAVDAFLYDSADLGRLSVSDPEVLRRPHRSTTERAWRAAFVARFPDPGILHCLSVCWYWSAMTADGAGDSAPAPEWMLAVAGWAALLASGARWATLRADERGQVMTRIAERLKNDLVNQEQAQRDAGNTRVADAFRGLARDFDSEAAAARSVAAIGYGLAGGPLTCGPQLLSALGLFEMLEADLDRRERQMPSDTTTARVRLALSRVARAEWLLRHGEPEAAIDLVNALPAAQRQSPGARRVSAEAKHLIGVRHGEAGRVHEALAVWQEVITAGLPEFSQHARHSIVRLCKTTAAEWQNTRRDEAIGLLENGLALTQEIELGHDLATLLYTRSVQRVNAALQGVDVRQAPPPPAAIDALRAELQHLNRATALGSPRSEEEARFVRGVLNQDALSRRTQGELDFNSLSSAARRRLIDAMSGRGDPKPLVTMPPRDGGLRLRWAAVAGVFLVIVFLGGFGQPGGFAYHGLGFVPVYAVLLSGLTVAVADMAYRRVLARAVPYPVGSHLFALDVVDAGPDSLQLRPLQTAKMDVVQYYNAGRYLHTLITFTFGDGAISTFRVSPQARADQVLQDLEKARQTERAVLQGGELGLIRELDPLGEAA
jgi:hypothetical protein